MKMRWFVIVLMMVVGSPVFASESGDLWESTVEMTAPGSESFAMPAMKFCRPKGEWNEPPAPPGDSTCEMSDVHRSGQQITWKMTCTSPPATGTGRMEFSGNDSYEGTIAMSSDQGEMVMNMSGRRIGECDAGKQQIEIGGTPVIDAETLKKSVADAQALQSGMLAKMCFDGAKAGQAFYFVGPNAMCTEPQYKEAFCNALLTQEGYESVLADNGMGVSAEEAIRFCGKEPDGLRREVCDKAFALDSLGFVDKHCPERREAICARALHLEMFEMLDDRCPAQAEELAGRECAGRQYSSMVGEKYRGFCSQYAASEMKADTEAQPTEEQEAKQGAISKAKKRFKRLAGR